MATDYECSIELREFLEGSAQPRVTQMARGLGMSQQRVPNKGLRSGKNFLFIAQREQRSNASAFTAFPRNFDRKFNQGFKHLGIVLGNLAKDTLKHFSLLASMLGLGVRGRDNSPASILIRQTANWLQIF